MSLKGIKGFLERLNKITPPEILVRNRLKEEILKQTKIDLDLKSIEYNPNSMVVKIKESPARKNLIFIQKEKILKELKKELGKKAPKNIL